MKRSSSLNPHICPDCAAAWNIMCAMETEELRPEMQDIPSRMEKKEVGAEVAEK